MQRPETGRGRSWLAKAFRPSPTFLLVLVTVLAGVVVMQEINIQSAAVRTETYYRKALVAIGDKQGQTVAAAGVIEEFGTTRAKAAAAKQQRAAAAAQQQQQGQQGQQAAQQAQYLVDDGGGGGGGEQSLEDVMEDLLMDTAAAGGLDGDGASALVRTAAQQAAQGAAAAVQAAGVNVVAVGQQGAAASGGGAGATGVQLPQDAAVGAGGEAASSQAAAGAGAGAGAGAVQQLQQQEAVGGAATARPAERAAAEQLAGGVVGVQAAVMDGAATTAAQQQQTALTAQQAQQVQQALQVAAGVQAQQQQQAQQQAATGQQLQAAQQQAVTGQQLQAAQQQQQQAAQQAAQQQVLHFEGAEDDLIPGGSLEDEWWTPLGEPRTRPADIPHGLAMALVQADALRPLPTAGAGADATGAGAAAQGQDGGAAGAAGQAAGQAGQAEQPAGSCKIYVLDAAREFGPLVGAPICDVNSPFIWPFNAPGKGIDGQDSLQHQDSQYALGYWISEAIRSGGHEAPDLSEADFVYVDMHCYHAWWMSWHHPLGSRSLADPTLYIQRTLELLQDMPRFLDSRGADFGLLQPGPALGGLLPEPVLCEELASTFHMVVERSSLCVWTRDSAARRKALVLPYVATTHLGLELPEPERDIFLYFRGGCGSPDPAVRHLFAAGKMLRYYMVERLQGRAPDIQLACSCDICDNHEPHEAVLASMHRSVFCPVVASNVQSSRRLSEAVLSGCIPVFLGPPFHTLPLAAHVDYASMAVFLKVEDDSLWINRTSRRWEVNHMVSKAWRLDADVESAVVTVPTLEAAHDYLRSLPAEEVRAKQDAVRRERYKFYYPPAPLPWGGAPASGGRSVLGEVIVGEMCERAAQARARRQAAAEAEGAVPVRATGRLLQE